VNPKTIALVALALIFLGYALLKIWVSAEAARLCLELLKDGTINDQMREICSEVSDDIDQSFSALLEIAAAGVVGVAGVTALASRSSRDSKGPDRK
jgi:hypothetical protein